MILESLKNAERIKNLHPLFNKAFEYILNTDFSTMKDGTYEIDGKNITASISIVRTKPVQQSKLIINISTFSSRFLELKKSDGNQETNLWKFPHHTTIARTSLSSLTSLLLSSRFIPVNSPFSSLKTDMLRALAKV